MTLWTQERELTMLGQEILDYLEEEEKGMIAIGSDHGGYELKQEIINYFVENRIEYKDFGCYGKGSCDYPEYGQAVAKAVASGGYDKGIVICTTGIGISITANKVKGIRCALCSDMLSARLTREHNDANVLALGGGIVGINLALGIVDTFLNTEFSGEEKHCRRIAAINTLEEEMIRFVLLRQHDWKGKRDS